VTRFKKNTPLTVVEELAVPPQDGAILSDRIGFLPKRQTRSRANPMGNAMREVCVRTDTGKRLRILSNDLDAPAREIAELYKRRWAIELFFRWIKQTLKITRFVGTSLNAVRIQIAVALIVFLLLRLAHAAQKAVPSPLAFARLVRANLMHRTPVDGLLRPQPPKQQQTDQMELAWP
jgi:IS4 transposase